MPGNVKVCDPATLDTFPEGLFSDYSVSLARHAIANEYGDGSTQRSSDVTTSKRSWRFSRKVTASKRTELYQFYMAHVGKPFLFRDVHTGLKYTGVFTSGWQEAGVIGRSVVSFEIGEVY